MSRIRIKQGQTVGEFYDKIRILLSSGRAAYRAKYNVGPPAGERDPLLLMAINSFIDGLPTHISEAVEIRDPTTLEATFKIAERLAIREDRRKRREISPSWVVCAEDYSPRATAREESPYSGRGPRSPYPEWEQRTNYWDNRDYYRARESSAQYREERPRYNDRDGRGPLPLSITSISEALTRAATA